MDHPEVSFRLRAVPAAVFVDLLRAAGEPMDARALKRRLAESGVATEAVEAAWRRAQPGVRRHANVAFDRARGCYWWSATPMPGPVPGPTPAQALERLLRGRVPAALKAELAEQLRGALRDRDDLEAQARRSYQSSRLSRAHHERQIQTDAVRALAELAMEVEELAAAGADPDVLVERIRALVKAFELEPIGRAGERIAYDSARHAPIGAPPPAGSAVIVVRPGYGWRRGEEDVLLEKAQVALG